MHYKFPVINHIDEVLPHIKDSKEFVVAERDGFTVINYVVQTPETFPAIETEGDAIRRECRGITFYQDGTVAARKLHKFFNVNERDETQFHTIDITKPHVILHKLDGSMITPFLSSEGKIEYHTKMGATDVALPAGNFAHATGFYDDFCFDLIGSGMTPIFEWMSRKNRIVIDYADDALVLTAIRKNITGEYLFHDQMHALADPYSIPVVAQYEATFNADFLEYVRTLIGLEGFVVRFDDGHMVKIKAEDYLKLHRAKEAISQEKNVWALILDADVDDMKGFLNDEDRVRVEKFETALWGQIQNGVDMMDGFLASASRELHDHDEDDRQRAFAVDYVQKDLPKALHSIAYQVFAGKDTREMFVGWVKSNLSTKNKLESIREYFGDIRFDEEDNE